MLLSHSVSLAGITSCSSFNYTPSDEEHTLHELINQYRQQNGLSAIQLSKSLTYVARTHVQDLQTYPPSGNCNLHSWSQYGEWSACCYTPDHAQASCMWNKPRELTPYEGNGFEIAAWSSISIDANNALNLWKSSPPHNAVILNQGIWSNYPWSSIGTGIYGNNAVVWFGEEVDSCGYFGGNSCPISFYDVPHGFWAEDYITTIACNGITTGCGGENYCPTQNVNRAQMAAFIIRGLLANGSLAQEPPDNFCGTTNPFPDVLYDHWACKYIKKTSELGITAGYPDGTYRLTNNVTRAEMAVFIVRAVEGDPAAGYCGGVDPFTDVASTHWACGHIKRLLELGISSGYGDSTYKPTQNVNRAQMAVYIGRAFLGMP